MEAIAMLGNVVTAPVVAEAGPGWWVVLFPLGWLLVIGALFFLFRRGRWGWGGRCGPGHGRPLNATEVLERRFAEGDLSGDEFRQRRELLSEQLHGRADR